MDEDNLTVGLMEQLIKFLPTPDLMNQLAAHRSEFATLAEPEQFALIVRYVAALLFCLVSAFCLFCAVQQHVVDVQCRAN